MTKTMTDFESHPAPLKRLHLVAIVVGVVCTIISIIGASMSPNTTGAVSKSNLRSR